MMDYHADERQPGSAEILAPLKLADPFPEHKSGMTGMVALPTSSRCPHHRHPGLDSETAKAKQTRIDPIFFDRMQEFFTCRICH